MFFVGIFGIEEKSKEIKTLNISCKNCRMAVTARLVKGYSFFHFFFIPIFKWNENYYLICNGCNTLFTIPKEKGKTIENGENLEISYWDMVEVTSDRYGMNRCSNCGAEIDANFSYCPNCGEKIK